MMTIFASNHILMLQDNHSIPNFTLKQNKECIFQGIFQHVMNRSYDFFGSACWYIIHKGFPLLH